MIKIYRSGSQRLWGFSSSKMEEKYSESITKAVEIPDKLKRNLTSGTIFIEEGRGNIVYQSVERILAPEPRLE